MHGIFKRDKQQGRRQAWHGLTEVREDLSFDKNFLREWDIQHEVLRRFPDDPSSIDGIDTPYRILVATDDNEIIGKPYAETYKPLTNARFLDFIQNSIAQLKNVQIESVGSICNRGRVFVSVKIEDAFEYTIGHRAFQEFLNFGNGHDQTSSLWTNNTNTCTVCYNTFTYNMMSGDVGDVFRTRVAHREGIEEQLLDVQAAIQNFIAGQERFKTNFKYLDGVSINQDSALAVIVAWLARNQPIERLSARMLDKAQKIHTLFNKGAGNSGDTLADLFSAVTDFYTHNSSAGNGKNKLLQFYNSEFGPGMTAKQSFWETLLDEDLLINYKQKGFDLLIAS